MQATSMKPFKNGLPPDAISLYTIVLLPPLSFKKSLQPLQPRFLFFGLDHAKEISRHRIIIIHDPSLLLSGRNSSM